MQLLASNYWTVEREGNAKKRQIVASLSPFARSLVISLAAAAPVTSVLQAVKKSCPAR